MLWPVYKKGHGSNTGGKSKLTSPSVLMCFVHMEKRNDLGNLYWLNMMKNKDTSQSPNEKNTWSAKSGECITHNAVRTVLTQHKWHDIEPRIVR